MESKKNIALAIIKTMQEIKGVEKNLAVSTGSSSYKAVSDKDVKAVIKPAMAKNGLCILPIKIEQDTQQLVKETSYNGHINKKPYVFTEVKVTYLLLHESGESIEIQGIGHGVDSIDKAAGKATTYALKYALLYTFLVATGHIDDADKTEPEISPKGQITIQPQTIRKKLTDQQFQKAKKGTVKQIKNVLDNFELSDNQINTLLEIIKTKENA